MIVSNSDMTDEEFASYMEPFEEKMDAYAKKLVQDYVAYVIANAYNMNRMFKNSKYEYECKDALDYLYNACSLSNCDFDEINELLQNNYLLKIVNKDPIDIEKSNSASAGLINEKFVDTNIQNN